MTPLEEFYELQPEPQRGCFLAMREMVLNLHPDVTAAWKWHLPFFYLKGKMFCYFGKNNKTNEPYIGFHKSKNVEHPKLEIGDRKMIKIFRINPHEDFGN